ncbi:MAG: retroviral-like aspartic protease family protein, partial [Chloroflexi bacterium]|nr:retroviral-like aspartic protease family protein [Chloroflexota bacterium]
MRFAYDPAYVPPAPVLEIRLGVPGEALVVGPLPALVDTGADATIVPAGLLRSLHAQVDDRRLLRTPWGDPVRVNVYLLDVAIGDLRLPAVEVVADERGDEVILGRNVLNKLMVTLD